MNEGSTWNRKATDWRQRKTLIEGYILQWMDKALRKGEKQNKTNLCGTTSKRNGYKHSKRVTVLGPFKMLTWVSRVGLCLCCFLFFFFFFFVPQLYLWGSPLLGEIFAYVTVFFNPTIKVVTFRLRGWCVLGVFLLPAFTRLGHERQDLLSPCDEMHVCID